MIRQSLPGIIFLGYVQKDRLQRQIMQKSLAGLPVGIFTDITLINFIGAPQCESQNDYDNNGRIEQTTLTFVTCDSIPTHEHLAFVITDANGQSYIIGQRERPYPIIKIKENTGTPGGDTNAKTVEVTLYAHRSLVPCKR